MKTKTLSSLPFGATRFAMTPRLWGMPIRQHSAAGVVATNRLRQLQIGFQPDRVRLVGHIITFAVPPLAVYPANFFSGARAVSKPHQQRQSLPQPPNRERKSYESIRCQRRRL